MSLESLEFPLVIKFGFQDYMLDDLRTGKQAYYEIIGFMGQMVQLTPQFSIDFSQDINKDFALISFKT